MPLSGYLIEYDQGVHPPSQDERQSPGDPILVPGTGQGPERVGGVLWHHDRVTKTAYLRVYSPEAESSGDPVPGFVKSYGLLSESNQSGEWVIEWEGRRLICPRNLRLRVLESTVAFANAFAGFGVGLIPEESANAADRELRQYQREHPSHRSHVLTSAWHVPVRWFGAFSSDDREVYEHEGRPRVRFRVSIETAMARVEKVLEVLKSIDMFDGPADETGQLLGWLDQFESGSVVELDYADVSDLFEGQDLVLDDSADLVQESVEALASGDMLRAGEAYGRVVTRWAHAFSVTFSS